MKMMFSAITIAIATPPSSAGERHHNRSRGSALSSRSSLRVSPHTSPRSSSLGFGLVTSDTATSTTVPTMNAQIDCQKLALNAEP
jgi:hypothetical protein